MFLPSIMQYFNDLSPAEALTYAPATGRPDLRKKWREELLRKNPSLAGKTFSTPIVTGGVTHALSLVADLFVDKGEMVMLPDKYLGELRIALRRPHQAQIRSTRSSTPPAASTSRHPPGVGDSRRKLEDGAGAELPQQSHRLLRHRFGTQSDRRVLIEAAEAAATWSS